LRGIIATASGYGAQGISTSIGTVLAYYNVQKNSMQTSTWDGFTLTVGAGEDGVWDVYGSVHMQQVGTDANYAQMIIENKTTGEQDATESTGQMVAGTGLSLSAGAIMKLNVGDRISSAFYHQAGIAWFTQPDTSMRFTAYLISK
jgi:hypothetical protein